MIIESLIREVVDEITGLDWSPGAYPQTLANIKTRPVGCWWVTTATGGSTSTRPEAYVRTTVRIDVWAATAEARASAADVVRAAFIGCGFSAAPSGQHEVGLPAEQVAYVASLTFNGLIDLTTNWVYRS
jgi:hypothetical protein